MSIFRETFPEFIQEELDRRQNGILARTPRFIHELNTRSAWVRMTSGVNTANKDGIVSNDLAKKYVLQAGTLTYKGSVVDEKTGEVSNAYALKAGLGGAFSTNAYGTVNASGEKYRLGIRPMAGITGVSVKSKGAYGSLQEATVSFVAWDVRQLEELELLFMRPGYTVLLEFGWDFTKPIIPEYDILNKKDIELTEAFVEIYQKITDSGGNYDALLGYVTNYNWSARDDGGYDCTTTIISLGEVLESLKVNWIPINTYAFDTNGSGLLGQGLLGKYQEIATSYEQGIIPGLLHELWIYLESKAVSKAAGEQFIDPTFKTKYDLYKNPNNTAITQNDRNGYPKPLGKDILAEAYITLGSFCDLLNNYVLLKGVNNNPLSQVTAYEMDASGRVLTEKKQVVKNFTNPSELPLYKPNAFLDSSKIPQIPIPSNSTEVPSSLKCIANPLSISTNLGVCLVRNDNWQSLVIQAENAAKEEESNQTTTPPTKSVKNDILIAISKRSFANPGNVANRFQNKITNPADDNNYVYAGDLAADVEALASDLLNAIIKVDVRNVNGKQVPTFLFAPNGASSFISSTFAENAKTINFFDYFYKTKFGYTTSEDERTIQSLEKRVTQAYEDLFIADYDGDRTTGFPEDPAGGGSILRDQNRTWKRGDIKALLESALTRVPINTLIQEQLTKEIPEVVDALANEASKAPGVSSDINEFLLPITSEQTKSIGNIANIYVNINFLYSQAISRNVASNDTQNKSVISIREYLQGVLREIQNSLGNINNFDLQVDSRNAIGRIIDINYTEEPTEGLFLLQIHNLNSIVRSYSFQSKIFPEMGSIIAISAQDVTGIGKLGYDNATLVAWNDGVVDRLIPKRDFTSLIKLDKEDNPITFIYPFLTKMYNYFQATQGNNTDNLNFAYGGLNFAYRDFLAYLARIDERNNFKAIIPTELSVTLDGIGGIVIGNIFTINQDIIPKGYKSTSDRRVAYIVTRIEHTIQDNDWTTTLKAYPIIYELKKGTNVLKDWKQQEYPGPKPGERIITISAGGVPIARLSTRTTNQNNLRQAVRFFLDRGFTDIQVAALVGGFIQESRVNPEIINSIGAIGIAQWLKDRKTKLLSKAEPTSLITQLNFVIEEFNNDEKNAGDKLKKSKTLEEAIVAAAFYERYEGITILDGVTYDEVLRAPETGNRIAYTQDILARIRSGEFGDYTSPTDPNAEVNSIISDINKAVSGGGTKEKDLVNAIGRIKNKETFAQVNRLVNIENILNGELANYDAPLGGFDRPYVDSIKTKLAKIGVTLTYAPEGYYGAKDIKIVF
jgi:hypothetical protein